MSGEKRKLSRTDDCGETRCTRIGSDAHLSRWEDLQHGQVIDGVRVVNPFV
jgi:hypothetical protein